MIFSNSKSPLALAFGLALSLSATDSFAQGNAALYNYKVDLNEVVDDQLKVELNVNGFDEETATFHLPKMVPGTYSIYDFGRFVSDFKAFDKDGKELEVTHDDPNTWVIEGAKTLTKIEYSVEDTWDTQRDNVIFEPAGTNIDENEVFVFNNHGIFGYFKGKERVPIRIEVDRPESFFGGTSMKRVGGDKDTDIFEASSYHYLVDSPIMFSPPDTANIKVGDADVLIHTYSPTGRVKSKDLVGDIAPILEAQREYLGGYLPVDNYAFLIFLNEEGEMYLSQAAGALEHSYSSFYCLFEGEAESIAQTVRDVAAHEFFHIVTPLSIHSEHIHYFDFIEPEMSEHLWLYEGVTEYSAQHVQVKQGLVTMSHFLNEMSEKMRTADYFNNEIAFTEMSKTCLDENKDQYSNVYLKGALIGMCVDLKLRILSEGEYGIQDMMRDLSQKYGIEKPFEDAKLFDEIVEVTGYEEMGDFFANHVAGTEPLPIPELLAEAGISYKEDGVIQELSPLGFTSPTAIGLDMERGMIKIADEGQLDEFGRDYIGFKTDDLIQSLNGEELNLMTINEVLTNYATSAVEGAEVTIVVLREKGWEKKNWEKKRKARKKKKKAKPVELIEVELTTTLEKVDITVEHAFVPNEDASEQEMKIRKSWLGTYKED